MEKVKVNPKIWARYSLKIVHFFHLDLSVHVDVV